MMIILLKKISIPILIPFEIEEYKKDKAYQNLIKKTKYHH